MICRKKLKPRWVNGISPVDVMNATYEDQSALNNWKPYNKQDITAIAQGLGKEHAEVS